MDPKRSATEMGNKLQSGEEPLSGEQGKGTAEQPFDQGNAEGESHSGTACRNFRYWTVDIIVNSSVPCLVS